MTIKLTKRQKDALKAIHSLTICNGTGPTIREMGIAMDVASDQTVLEMLERLEKAGLIFRDKKQARSTSLTEKGRLALGVVNINSGNDGTSKYPLELDEQEQRVYNHLAEIDIKLGSMYKGAMSAINAPINEDYIAQSAHSMREIIDHLSNKGSAKMPDDVQKRIKDDKNTRRTVYGLYFLFDPQAGISVEQNPYKYLYNEYQTKLQKIAHHDERIDETEYRNLIKNLEQFLLRYVFPSQIEIYKLLENKLNEDPKDVNATDLLLLVKKNVESNRFFFKHADAQWLEYLRINHFLDATIETGTYLSRVAQNKPQATLEFFLETTIPAADWQTRDAFATAASKLPPSYAAKTVNKIISEEWLKSANSILISYKLRDLLVNLLQGKEYEQALALVDYLLDVFPGEYGSYSFARTSAYISEYEYAQIVNSLTEIPLEEIFPFLQMLVSKLIKMISTVHAKYENKNEDYSHTWRPAIEDNSRNHLHDDFENAIITGIRDLLEKHIGNLNESGDHKVAKMTLGQLLTNTPQYTILTRIKIHIYRQFPEVFKEEIEAIIANPFSEHSVWHEYLLLTNSVFPKLSQKVKNGYLGFIDKQDKKDDKFIDSCRVRFLAVIKEYLTPAQKKKYASLLKNAQKLEELYFEDYIHEGYISHVSPKSESEMEGKDIKEVIDMLKTWTPGDEFYGPSRYDLGLSFRNVVIREAAKYSTSATLFSDQELRPVYIYNLLSGMVEALKNNSTLDWDAILSLISIIIERAKNKTLLSIADEKKDVIEADWENVMQEIARLLIRGLDRDYIPFNQRDIVWGIIKYLAEHTDPTPEYEQKYGGDNCDPYTTSINTVRGETFHAVHAYIFWYNRTEKNTEKTWKAHIPEEVKAVIESHLDPTHDPSLAIRSVYGRFFPWLLSYGDEWAQDLIPKIFPLDNTDLRYAAWETYLSNMVFEDAYKRLRPLYELAIKDIRDGKVPKRKYWVDTTERLSEHAMIAYSFEIEEKDNSFYEHFFKNASGKCRGKAVSMGGRSYVSRDNVPQGEKTPRVEVLQRFWEWRLEDSTAPSELREFGWWAKAGKFNNAWMLEHLLETIEKTKGDLGGEFIVMDTLESLATEYPLLCAKITKIICTSNTSRNHFIFMYMEKVRAILLKILQSKNQDAIKIADDTIDHLLKLGYEDSRNLNDLAKRVTE